jgi:hypothetical protein
MNGQFGAGVGTATPTVAHSRRDFRLPLAPRIFALFGVTFLAAVTGIMIVLAASRNGRLAFS